MADGTRTRKITRDQIAQIVGNNPRAIKMLEALAQDVSATLPDAIDQVQLSALFSLHGADGSKSAAQTALHLVLEVQAITAACQRLAGDVKALRDEVEHLRAEQEDNRARLSSSVSRLQVASNDALTLAIGAF